MWVLRNNLIASSVDTSEFEVKLKGLPSVSGIKSLLNRKEAVELSITTFWQDRLQLII